MCTKINPIKLGWDDDMQSYLKHESFTFSQEFIGMENIVLK